MSKFDSAFDYRTHRDPLDPILSDLDLDLMFSDGA